MGICSERELEPPPAPLTKKARLLNKKSAVRGLRFVVKSAALLLTLHRKDNNGFAQEGNLSVLRHWGQLGHRISLAAAGADGNGAENGKNERCSFHD